MDLTVRTHEKGKLDIEFIDERKTVLYLIKERLLEEDNVETATVHTDHPQLGHPRMVVHTSSGKPETALRKAAAAARKDLDELEDAFLAGL